MFFVLAVGLANQVLAQQTGGSLFGYIWDPSGRAVPGVLVEAREFLRQVTRRTTTDETGFFRLVQLAPGTYQVAVSKPSFQSQLSPLIPITVDSSRQVDFQLALDTASTTVEVKSTALQTEASDSGYTIERQRIEKLPLNRRNFLQLALLVAGLAPPVQDSELSTRGAFAAHANGGREEFNNFLLDGVDNNDLYTNRYVMEPSVDTIQEFKITAGSYSAEYGRSGGAQINVITRSGTNSWHGTLYEYFRNRRLDAGNYFETNTRNKYGRNQFGGVLGGPVRKNRTFVFFNADLLEERRGLSRLATVPRAVEREGDFSSREVVVRDPLAWSPFPNNLIPPSRIHRLARKIVNLFPAASSESLAGNLLAQPVLRESFPQGGARWDEHCSGGHSITVRHFYGRQHLFEPYAEESTDVPGFGNFVQNPGHNALVHYQRSFRSGVLSSLRLGFNRATRKVLPENHSRNIAQEWDAQWLDGIAPRSYGYPFFNVQGLSPVGDATPLPLIRFNTTYQLMEDLAWIRGRHTLKVGFQGRATRSNANVDLLARGSLSFSGALTGVGFADLLLGLPSFTLQAKLDNTQTLRTTSYNLYAQDEWRPRPRLSLVAGLRYEFNTPATDPYNRMSVLNLGTGEIVRVGTQGVSRSGIGADRNNFAPRLGLAWNLRPNLVLRTGYGLYFDSGMLVVASSQYFNPPFFVLRAFFPTSSALLSLDDPFPSRGGIWPVSPSTVNPDFSTAYVQHWSFGLQQQWGAATTLSAFYAGSKGTHLIRSRDLNQAPPGPGDVASRRPDPRYGGIIFIESAASSNYHSLQLTLDRRLFNRTSLLAAYTWSKSIDDTSAFLSTKPDKNFPQNSNDFRAERGLSSFDLGHRLVAAAVVALPKKLELRAIQAVQGGQAFTPLLRFDNSNSGNTGGNFGSDRPNVLRRPSYPKTVAQWFETAAFAVPPRFRFGNAGRNVLRGPGYASLDVALSRSFAWNDRLRLTLEFQTYNVLNRRNFDLPERYADEPATFGRIFSAKAPRQTQLALRLGF
ncbi:MAG: TonB-dependent receptor [Bryobacteraceae bacterium]|nr:TonB-dependent receptor [Bryobacteraceae bacterium]MDW8379138.1 TonB-dependent receptor [Bryobacterales bacterium]